MRRTCASFDPTLPLSAIFERTIDFFYPGPQVVLRSNIQKGSQTEQEPASICEERAQHGAVNEAVCISGIHGFVEEKGQAVTDSVRFQGWTKKAKRYEGRPSSASQATEPPGVFASEDAASSLAGPGGIASARFGKGRRHATPTLPLYMSPIESATKMASGMSLGTVICEERSLCAAPLVSSAQQFKKPFEIKLRSTTCPSMSHSEISVFSPPWMVKHTFLEFEDDSDDMFDGHGFRSFRSTSAPAYTRGRG